MNPMKAAGRFVRNAYAAVWKRRGVRWCDEHHHPEWHAGVKAARPGYGAQSVAMFDKIRGATHIPAPTLTGNRLNPALRKLLQPPARRVVTGEGVDVYNGTGGVDWHTVRRSGRSWAYLKATEGLGFVDQFYTGNVHGCAAAGVWCAPYHFIHTDADPEAQADHFCRTAGWRHGMLAPCIDYENRYDGNGHQVGPTIAHPTMRSFAERLALRVHELTGQVPLLYGSAYTFQAWQVPSSSFLARCSLWVAAYPHIPFMPEPWGSALIHQYGSNGSVPGVSGRCDVDRALRPIPIL